MKTLLSLLFTLAWLAGCQRAPAVATPSAGQATATARPVATPTTLALPTLLPTRTPDPPPTAAPTRAPPPTAGPTAEVDFNAVVVRARYAIPGLGLARTLAGTVSGQVTLVDEATGQTVVRPSQGPILLELQRALPELTLGQLPDDCPFCVQFDYEMPLGELSASGWLTNSQMLASIENYTAVFLGPHFPPDTVVGLRRSASAYKAAHTLALTADGRLWRWLAIDDWVAEPLPDQQSSAAMTAAVERLARLTLRQGYAADCPGAPVEMLYFRLPDAAAGDLRQVRLVCPQLSLPAALLPLYQEIDLALAPFLDESGLPLPPPAVPLSALLDYLREDGSHLTLPLDGEVVSLSLVAGELVTTSAALVAISSLTPVSLTEALVATGALAPGAAAIQAATAANRLFVRAENGVFSAGWDGSAPAALRPLLAALDEWLTSLASAPPENGDQSATPTSTPGSAPAVTPTP